MSYSKINILFWSFGIMFGIHFQKELLFSPCKLFFVTTFLFLRLITFNKHSKAADHVICNVVLPTQANI